MQEDMNNSWLNERIKEECKIKELEREEKEIVMCSEAYRDIFNGAPFYEDWTIASALEEINGYMKDNAIILTPILKEQIIGFLVAMRGVPENQKEYVPFDNKEVMFIEEIGVLGTYRHLGIASELVRNLLLNYLAGEKYLIYRTNAMRYFELTNRMSFETLKRIEEEDRLRRQRGKDIPIASLSDRLKQKFINEYVNMIKRYPELDVSNSNALFRDIFGNIDFCEKESNYSFQKDPSENGNDRIFSVVDLGRSRILQRR